MSISILHRFYPERHSLATLKPAGFRERVMAQLIDGIILGVLSALLLLVFSGGKIYSVWISPFIPVYLVHTVPGYVASASDWWWGGMYHTISIRFLADIHLSYPSAVHWLIYACYYGIFHNVWGQTPGKMLKGLVVLDEDGRFISAGKAFLRWVFYLGSLLPLGFGFWSGQFTGTNQTWHDRIAHTTVWQFVRFE